MDKALSKITPEIIAGLNQGDEDAFHTLFVNYQPRLYRFLWAKVRAVDVAEDLVQETFLRVWRARERLDSTQNIEVYLFKIANNVLIDYLRKNQKTVQLQELSRDLDVEDVHLQSHLEAEDMAVVADRIVNAMPDKPRTAFVLSRHHGLAYHEIAKIMDITTKTVEKHISKVLRALREHLKAPQSK